MKSLCHSLLLTTLFVASPSLVADSGSPATVMRIFWQDRETDRLSWADLTRADKWSIARGWVKNFPKLDSDQQDLVQMKQISGVLTVGVRDHDNGQHQSGWVAVQTGVTREPHGDHEHWRYLNPPSVLHQQLDQQQGNPAHLYIYDEQFLIANDSRNGFTRIDPISLTSPQPESAATFFPGGGGHITLATVDRTVGYSSWIMGGGPNAGRVDVVDLRQKQNPQIAYSFHLATGAIHGATTNSGKVFLAPAAGISWVRADTALQQSEETVDVHTLSLGTSSEDDKPLRTGAFGNARNWVLCTTGNGPDAALCLINSSDETPTVHKLPIPVADGLRLTPPHTVLSLGRRYALMFQDRMDADSDVQEHLTVVELDPNHDLDFRDARIQKHLPVGSSRRQGHFGHHAIATDAWGRYAVFTEPDEGILNVLSLKKLRIEARFRVGGCPDAITAVGAPEWNH